MIDFYIVFLSNVNTRIIVFLKSYLFNNIFSTQTCFDNDDYGNKLSMYRTTWTAKNLP